MAIKITTESSIKKVNPEKRKFDIDEFDEHVKGWAEPFEIGSAWVVFSEKRKNAMVNQLATLMFGVPIYGDVLIVPPQQMPKEWDVEEKVEFSVEDFDNGFLNSVEQTLDFVRQFEDIKEEWIYRADAIENSEEIADLFSIAYDFLDKKKFKQIDNNVLYEDDILILKSKSLKDSVHFLEQLLNHFVSTEEYEKCAVLKKVIDKYNKK